MLAFLTRQDLDKISISTSSWESWQDHTIILSKDIYMILEFEILLQSPDIESAF